MKNSVLSPQKIKNQSFWVREPVEMWGAPRAWKGPEVPSPSPLPHPMQQFHLAVDAYPLSYPLISWHTLKN